MKNRKNIKPNMYMQKIFRGTQRLDNIKQTVNRLSLKPNEEGEKDEIYYKLFTRLNENIHPLPPIGSVIKLLQRIYTKEYAAIGAEFPIGANTADFLAPKFKRNHDELVKILEDMADQGLIFVATNDNGVKEYSLTPFYPGLIEFQLMKGTHTPEDIEKAYLIKDIINELKQKGRWFLKRPKLANLITPRGLRTVTVEKSLPNDNSIQSYEQVSALINRETSFAAGVCHCRHQKKLLGGSCEKKNMPEHSCFYFGKVADYMVERGFARRFSKIEVMDILEQCHKSGAVHNITDYNSKNLVLCNCCGCCCEFLTQMNQYRGFVTVIPSNFLASNKTSTCPKCGKCIKRCPVEAISLNDESVSIDHSICIGCGNCVAICPSDSLLMTRCKTAPPIKIKQEIVGLGV